jgi:hypothetical protein
MARFFPNIPPDPNKSRAELKLFNALKSLSDEWCVLHSVYIHKHAYKRSAEADFLLLSPRVALVIEVKGGEVYAEAGEWCFRDRNGNINRKKESPYQQAESAWHALKKLTCENDDTRRLIEKMAHGWGCYLPDCEIPHDKISNRTWPPVMVCDSLRMTNTSMEKIILEMADFTLAKDIKTAKDNYWKLPTGLTPEEFEKVVSCFRINFNSIPSMTSDIEFADEQFVKLTRDQGDALWSMEDVKRLMVHGPAGTGKTLIAQRKFNTIVSSDENKRVAFVCFNTLLADYLSTLNLQKMKSGGSFVGTVHGLLREYSPALKTNTEDYEGCVKDLKIWSDNNKDSQFDYLIIDEGQDILAQPKLCEALGYLLKGGWDNGEWVWFEDRAQSVLRMGNVTFEPPKIVSYKLNKNVRNALNIAEFSNKFISKPATPSEVFGHTVKSQLHSATDEKGRYIELESQIQNLIKTGFKPQDIVVLDYSGKNEYLMAKKSIAGFDAYGWTSSPRKNVIRYSTVRKFKGLEAPAIVIYNVSGAIEKDDPLFYVASTRAKISLTVICSQEALLSISSILST